MSKPLDILHINTERSWRGGEQQTYSLAKGLWERGIACGLVCQPDTELAQRAKEAGITVFETGMHGEADVMSALQIRKIIGERNCKLVHTHTSHALTLGFWASYGLKIPRLATRRVAFSIYRHDFLKINGIKYKRMTSHFAAISQHVKDALVRDGIDGGKISVVYSGIDPRRFALVSPDRVQALRYEFGLGLHDKVILQAAHLSKEKGQDVMLKALPEILRENPNVKLILAGGGEQTTLRTLAGELGVSANVVFAGFREDMGALYHLCDLFVMPSLSEGLGTAALDALALRKPVVVSDAGGLPEIVTNNVSGLVAPAGNAGALASAVNYMLANYDRALAMADTGYDTVLQKFTLDKMVEGNLALYRRLCPGIFNAG